MTDKVLAIKLDDDISNLILQCLEEPNEVQDVFDEIISTEEQAAIIRQLDYEEEFGTSPLNAIHDGTFI